MDWTVLMGFLAGGGFLSFVQFLISRHDTKHSDLDGIRNEIKQLRSDLDAIDKKSDLREAVNARVRILRFNDELLEGRKHSKDSYDQTMSDITSYESFCEAHPDFKNNQTALTIENINRSYSKRLERHDFLYGGEAV